MSISQAIRRINDLAGRKQFNLLVFYIIYIINHALIKSIIYTILNRINTMQFQTSQRHHLPLKIYQEDSSFLSPLFPQHQFSWMDQYFNQDVLQDKLVQEGRVSIFLPQQNTLTTFPLSTEGETSEVAAVQSKNKSVFHNFQKHLLTLLKKIIVVKKTDLTQYPSGLKAYDLWKIFLGLESYAKKNLYIIFGVAQRENQKSLRAAALQIPELQRMLSKHGISEVEAAQRLLRRIVSTQATHIQREKLECECKMKKFDEFYCYFRGFIEQLGQGAISRRMTKQRKLRLIPWEERK